MKRLMPLCVGLVFAASLMACGNKGSLYLPDPQETKKTAQEANKTPQKQYIEKKQ